MAANETRQAGATHGADGGRGTRGMRLYDLLLHLYPASFRNEYADEMRPLFAQRRRAARGLDVFSLWSSTIAEVFTNATGAHLDVLKQDGRTNESYIALRRHQDLAHLARLHDDLLDPRAFVTERRAFLVHQGVGIGGEDLGVDPRRELSEAAFEADP